MGLWGDSGSGGGWCFCSGGGGVSRSDRMKAGIFSAKGAALAAVGGGGAGGSGLLIHRNLMLTTHGILPSVAAVEAVPEIRLGHGRVAARFAPHRFFITSSILDLTIVGLDAIETDSTSSQLPQLHPFKTCCKPTLHHGSTVYLLGHTNKDLVIGEGKVIIATDNLIKLSTDGASWPLGSAGFDVQGNLAFMICDPMKCASSPLTLRSSSTSPSSSLSLKKEKDQMMQFGIPMPVICDWLHQHWPGNLDEVSKPRLPVVRLMSNGHRRGEHSSASFAVHHRIFMPVDGESDTAAAMSSSSRRISHLTNARISHDVNPLIDLRPSNNESRGMIPDAEDCQSPQASSFQAPKAPVTIFLPLPLKQMLSEGANSADAVCLASTGARNSDDRAGLQDNDCRSEMQSSSSPVQVHWVDWATSEEETMYSAETMESRNIPSPSASAGHGHGQPVGRSQSCVNYSRWSSPRNSTVQKGALQKQQTLVPVWKTRLQQSAMVPRGGHDYLSPTIASTMKKRNSMEVQPAIRPRTNIVPSSPKWLF